MMNLNAKHKKRIDDLGISEHEISNQFDKLTNGAPLLKLEGPCTPNNGIMILKSEDVTYYSEMFDTFKKALDITMFTPASGAATRMFKHLLNPESNAVLNQEFKDNLERFSFYDEIDGDLASVEDKVAFVLDKEGLNYARLPKAMIGFHKYGLNAVKAIDDQLYEGLNYLPVNKRAKFHFTISPEHKEVISNHVNGLISKLQDEFGIEIEVDYSFQQLNTNTIALDAQGNLVEEENGDLLLRPGGHGSLIHNLNEITSDVIFIKNIDNIARREFHPEVVKYKKVLGGVLTSFQKEVHLYLLELDEGVTSERLETISENLKDSWGILTSPDEKSIREALNKPIRVAGMVKNEGKAGGGPFWVNNSVQIVESAQMDANDPKVKQMLNNATHFNPVDLVCAVNDYNGNPFNLIDYVDDKTFFVSEKSYLGKDIKVLEHPGLWNGAMANWLTLFVEVPVATFNPVKTVNDLLLPQHCNV